MNAYFKGGLANKMSIESLCIILHFAFMGISL